MFLAISFMLMLTLCFALVILSGLLLFAFFRKSGYAVLRRNFSAYFTNPTGYVFLCLFVFLTSCAAFWPHNFFSANLANLDQLNVWLPYIMLIFIPAITMSIWAEERSQGTDELLLTLPATDFDIVLGKYLAAALIYTVSLLFSQISTFIVLAWLSEGGVDVGLIFATYFGYWMMGLAMLAIGMVASFLTNNLTVGFILGALFNAPLALAGSADTIITYPWLARWIGKISFLERFQDFGRGVFSLSSFTFFSMIVVIGVYLSVVLVGRRHWIGGRDGKGMVFHYLIRTVGLVLAMIGLSFIFYFHDWRIDSTLSGTNTLHPDTRSLIAELDSDQPVEIYAYISEEVPEEYAQTKYELESMLNEFRSISGDKLQVKMYKNLQPFGDDADAARKRFGIEPVTVATQSQGKTSEVDIILGAAFRSGLKKIVVPFFDYGIPVEYELVRSISTVAQGKRETIGVLQTDAQLYGGLRAGPMGMPQSAGKEPIITELEKQYDVESVDPNNEIDAKKFKVLLVVQPSSLTDPQLTNLVDAVNAGVPTAVFEDPLPYFMDHVPGTTQPRRPPPSMMQMGARQPEPKGDIKKLFSAIGVRNLTKQSPGNFSAPQVVWQRYNPYESKIQFQGFTDEWVFIREEAPGADETNPWKINPVNDITSGLEEILFPYPGAVEQQAGSDLYYQPLAKTGTFSGTISMQDVIDSQGNNLELKEKQGRIQEKAYTLAMRITAEEPDDTGRVSNPEKPEDRKLNVVYVADIDVLSGAFVSVRARPSKDINFRFDNVTFILNIIDVLAGEDKFVNIRNRKIRHATLRSIEAFKEKRYKDQYLALQEKQKDLDKEVKKVETDVNASTEKLKKQYEELQESRRDGEEVDLGKIRAIETRYKREVERGEERKRATALRVQKEVEAEAEELTRTTDLRIAGQQKWAKIFAVLIPPIPPLFIGIIVFLVRRLREREGMSKKRMRFN